MAKAIDEKIAHDMMMTAKHCRLSGDKVEINYKIPFIACVVQTKNGQVEVSFQPEEAASLLEQVPVNVNDEDYVLWYLEGGM